VAHYIYDRSEDVNEPLLVPGKITGYRLWAPHVTALEHSMKDKKDWKNIPWGSGSYLYSMNKHVKWKVEKVEAKCQLCRPKKKYIKNSIFNEHYETPHRPCQCGLYAKYSLDSLRRDMYGSEDIYIIGSITGWGKTILARTGFRCQYARVTSLLVNDKYSYSYMKYIGSHYNVPIFQHEGDLVSAFPPSNLSALGINPLFYIYGI